MLSMHLTLKEELNWSLVLRCLGQMPLEFFSISTQYLDEEALKTSAALIELVGKDRIQEAVFRVFGEVLQTKAVMETSKYPYLFQILQGVSRLLLVLSNKYTDVFLVELSALLTSSMEVFRQVNSPVCTNV